MSIVRIVYRSDGGVTVINPILKSKRLDETEKQWLKRVFNKAMHGELKDCPYDDIDSSELPQSRKDRDAWTGEKGKGISINHLKAMEIRIDREAKIKVNRKIRNMAIDNLKVESELSSDYQE